MDKPDPIDLLSRVQRTPAPPHLRSRIEERIASQSRQVLAPVWTWAAAAAVALLVAINVWALTPDNSRNRIDSKHDLEGLASEMGMTSSYQLYHD